MFSRSRLQHYQTRGIILICTSLLLITLFSNPPTEPNNKCEQKEGCVRLFQYFGTPQTKKAEAKRDVKSPSVATVLNQSATIPERATADTNKNHSEQEAKLFELEVNKVFDELGARIGYMDSWFHYKFVLIGAVLALTLNQFLAAMFGKKAKHFQKSVIPGVPDLHHAAALVLAPCCLVALVADIHIRIDAIMTGMLGNWIAYFVEPDPKGTGLYFWENFLRLDARLHDAAGGLHRNWVAQFTFSPHLHFLTWPLYIAYIWVFQEIALTQVETNRVLVRGTWWVVQVALLSFVVVAHSTPFAYDMKVYHLDSGVVFLMFLIVYIIQASLSLPYYMLLGPKAFKPIAEAP
jgi:hypothetical protein